MGTIVSLHAHPDDESIATSGVLALAADAGHRVILVFATRGELGEPVDGVLEEGEQLALRRTAECYESAAVIGAHRVEFLGFTDSGMMGEASNDAPWCFWRADVDHAARRLAVILREEEPDVITIYDDHGGYGHPDHIQVHRVGKRAAEIAGVPVVAQSTMNRDLIQRSRAAAAEMGIDLGDNGPPPELPDDFGTPEAQITHAVDTVPVIHRKRSSMLAHGSQIGADHFMAALPLEAFQVVFGSEWFIVDDVPADPPPLFTELFTPLATGPSAGGPAEG
jgi:LmbE family N-acetylglucosaminyl deacetylase